MGHVLLLGELWQRGEVCDLPLLVILVRLRLLVVTGSGPSSGGGDRPCRASGGVGALAESFGFWGLLAVRISSALRAFEISSGLGTGSSSTGTSSELLASATPPSLGLVVRGAKGSSSQVIKSGLSVSVSRNAKETQKARVAADKKKKRECTAVAAAAKTANETHRVLGTTDGEAKPTNNCATSNRNHENATEESPTRARMRPQK
ncbi:unnamed protein product [Phytophthora fragariaefolia]|uniref:Unnamed protein product n=1 Tax=Phytophthora fragariaefolia TaxID=1490495 RepID=A0A9W6XSL5_9STRA|nr:unnamed protein product [Phytophthora fragariaefolia]